MFLYIYNHQEHTERSLYNLAYVQKISEIYVTGDKKERA